MGWMHIPDFDLIYGKDWECSYNLWNGKNTKPIGKISIALPPDDWLCRKMVILN